MHTISVLQQEMQMPLFGIGMREYDSMFMCRDASSSVTVQLCAMQNVSCVVTSMTANSTSSIAIIGLSSGQLLCVAVRAEAVGISAADINAGKADSPPARPVGSSPAALAFDTLPEQHTAAVTAAELSPDANMLASLSAADGGVICWTSTSGSGRDFKQMSAAEVSGAICIAWAPAAAQQPERLLVGCSNGELVVNRTQRHDIHSGVWHAPYLSMFHAWNYLC